MKKLLLIIACLYSVNAQAQDRGIFICSTPEACQTVVDSLLHGSKRTYLLKEAYMYNNRYIMEYMGAVPGSTDSVNMRVVFVKTMRGADPDLEIPGTLEYSFYCMYGKYLDLFPIWKEYVDPSADLKAISEKERSERKEFTDPDGSGEAYWMNKNGQDKTMWELYRSAWTSTTRM